MTNIEKQINENFKCNEHLRPTWSRCKTCDYYYVTYTLDCCLMKELKDWTLYKAGLTK